MTVLCQNHTSMSIRGRYHRGEFHLGTLGLGFSPGLGGGGCFLFMALVQHTAKTRPYYRELRSETYNVTSLQTYKVTKVHDYLDPELPPPAADAVFGVFASNL